ncbi:MAG: Gfo/Idh/MocA family oxidoreductase [Candidatus Cloacimonetes bacterium]|nr:Gfo/Idh/MocA family oxidoreductase [Candidatus Cloacimonadota bacterium]
MKNNKLRVGIIGYGVVGKKRRFFIDKNPNLETVAVCDVRFNEDGSMINGADFNHTYELLENRSHDGPLSGKTNDEVQFYNNYTELLANNALDILFVCVPNYLAPEVTIAGLEKGLHVFCEKPPGRTVEDVRKVIDVEKKHPHLKLKYGFNHRYHGSVKKVKEIIDKKQFGDIINFRGVYGKSSIVPFTGQWRSMKKFSGGGILLDQGIHMLDMFRYFCGDFEEVKSFVSNKYWDYDVEDNVCAILRNKNGTMAMIHSSATQWQHSFSLEITFEEGYLELSGMLSGSKSYGQEQLVIVRRQENSIVGSLNEEVITYIQDTSWNDEVVEFADLITDDKPVENGSSREALKVMELVYKIYCADTEWRNNYNL